jgi:rhamnulokinase
MATYNYGAIDLGAESGRVFLGHFDGKCLTLQECHRFSNGGVAILDSVYWDVLSLFSEVKKGIVAAEAACRGNLDGIGVDSWAVDFALLDRKDELLGNPHTYRDKRITGMMEKAFDLVSKKEIFEHTGIQFLPINTLYQLLAMKMEQPRILDMAETFLMISDLFHFWLTGEKSCEFTNATTTQFFNPRTHDWAQPLLAKMELPSHFLPSVLKPGTVIAPLATSIASTEGLKPFPVIAGATHDTAAAVMAVPTETKDYAYLSSGTWSLFGAEIKEPIITEKSLAYNFTNEGGVDGTFRFLKDLIGLWLLQECRRIWARSGEVFSYDQLTAISSEAPKLTAFIDPDYPPFLAPANMPIEICNFLAETGQPVPKEKGTMIRLILESLALKYRLVLEQLEEILGRRLEVLHIVGGGARNGLLCQFTADAIGRTVIAGPIESTVCGNILSQAIALGHLDSVARARQVVRNSFELVTYEPKEPFIWDEAFERFQRIMARTSLSNRKEL